MFPLVEVGEEIRIGSIQEEIESKVGKMSLSSMNGQSFSKRAETRKMSGFLDSAHAAEVLRTVLLTMTHGLADAAYKVFKRGVHQEKWVSP